MFFQFFLNELLGTQGIPSNRWSETVCLRLGKRPEPLLQRIHPR